MKTSFDCIWELLDPSYEYASRKTACQNLWNSFTLQKQRQLYWFIREQKRRGQKIEENPFFAINNTSPHPTNYNGHALDKDTQYVIAKYHGHYDTFTRAEAKLFEMTDVKPLN